MLSFYSAPSLNILVIVGPSMLPPLTITPIFPRTVSRLLISAATPRAPDGSTTSFMR